jgi:hypothetical protein
MEFLALSKQSRDGIFSHFKTEAWWSFQQPAVRSKWHSGGVG